MKGTTLTVHYVLGQNTSWSIQDCLTLRTITSFEMAHFEELHHIGFPNGTLHS